MRRIDERLRFPNINGSDWVTRLGCDNGPFWASSVARSTKKDTRMSLLRPYCASGPCQLFSSRLRF
jgi:hypothetical protein